MFIMQGRRRRLMRKRKGRRLRLCQTSQQRPLLYSIEPARNDWNIELERLERTSGLIGKSGPEYSAEHKSKNNAPQNIN